MHSGETGPPRPYPTNPGVQELHSYPSLIRKMKTYLELEGKLGNQPHTNIFCLTKTLPGKTPVLKKTDKKKRAKAPVKRRFKVRVTVQPIPTNPTLPMNPTSTQIPVAKTSNCICQI